MQRLVYNAIQTPDGTILVSRTRHDYVSHTDANGNTYAIDGGLDYQRTSLSGDISLIKDLSVYLEDGIEKCREVLQWGTRGKGGGEKFRWVILKDMTTEHIQACLDTQPMHPHYIEAFKMELEYRKNAKNSVLRDVIGE